MSISLETCTLPTAQTRPRSLRIRSTIIKFSDLSFSERARQILARSSSLGSDARAAVPLMVARKTSPVLDTPRNRSGDRQAMATPDKSKTLQTAHRELCVGDDKPIEDLLMGRPPTARSDTPRRNLQLQSFQTRCNVLTIVRICSGE